MVWALFGISLNLVVRSKFGYRVGSEGFCTSSSSSSSPDGALTDGGKAVHQRLPIAGGCTGDLVLISKPNTDKESRISGAAFSTNSWVHSVQSAFGYHWHVNGGEGAEWVGADWGGSWRRKRAP